MNAFSSISLPSLRLALLGVSAMVLYLACRLLLGAIPAQVDRPALRAMLGASVIAMVSMSAVLSGRPLVGLHLPIAAAMAVMTFGVAAVLVGRKATADANRSWALIVPAVAMLIIGGFGGRLDGLMAGALACYGAVALVAWRPDRLEPSDDTARRRSLSLMSILWIGTACVAALAGYLAVIGLPALEARQQAPADPIVVGFLLTPAIVVPLVFELLPPCRSLGWSGSMSTLVLFALLCITFVLPLVALVDASAGILRGFAEAATLATTTQATTTATTTLVPPLSHAMPTLVFPSMPPIALRVDALVLAGASLLAMPMAAGWLRAGRIEAIALTACYVLSLLLMMATMLS